MIKFNTPENLNGAQLLQELAEAGIKLTPIKQAPVLDTNNDLWLDIKPEDKERAEKIVGSHNGVGIETAITVEEKLASVGLSIDDLKAALGL